jgi:hypothetical protein
MNKINHNYIFIKSKIEIFMFNSRFMAMNENEL